MNTHRDIAFMVFGTLLVLCAIASLICFALLVVLLIRLTSAGLAWWGVAAIAVYVGVPLTCFGAMTIALWREDRTEPEPSERYEDLGNGVTRINLTQAERRGLRAPNVREIGD